MKPLPLCIALLIAVSFAHGRALAAVDLFLQLDGITGSSTDKAHPGWIDISSYDFGVTHSGSLGSAGSGKASFSDLSITKTVDKSSPALLFDAASGKHIKNGVLDVVKVGTGGASQPFLEYKFTSVLISSYSVSGAQGAELPQESLSLSFTALQFKEFTQKPDGSPGAPIITDWNLLLNKGSEAFGAPQVAAVPEPATVAMLAAGLGILVLRVGRKRRS